MRARRKGIKGNGIVSLTAEVLSRGAIPAVGDRSGFTGIKGIAGSLVIGRGRNRSDFRKSGRHGIFGDIRLARVARISGQIRIFEKKRKESVG